MKSFLAVYEKGVFRPLEPVDLPEGTRVQVTVLVNATVTPSEEQILAARARVREVLAQRYEDGGPDDAERHNEHRP